LFCRNANSLNGCKHSKPDTIGSFFPSKALITLRYRRMQRFLSEHWIDYNEVARFIMKLFDFTENSFYLSLDRTNWKWGKTNT